MEHTSTNDVRPPVERNTNMGAQTKVRRGHAHNGQAESVSTTEAAPAANQPANMKREDFDRELRLLQTELVKLQFWVQKTGAKICILFEGRDAAGKGGVIKRITARTSPRVFRIVALPAPTDREKSQMYMQRYVPHLPAAGEVVLFDRSWYNRAGVERVMGYASEEEVQRFLRMAPLVERAIVDSGIILVKYWLEVNEENQSKRFRSRLTDPCKRWKLSPMDLESHRRFYDYSRARDEMLAATDPPEARWYLVDSNDQRRGRLNCISHLLSLIPYEDVPQPEVEIPRRRPAHGYSEPDHSDRFIPERY
jgi:polyphosphate kinase 2